ncbi:MAG: NUDIX domain-containing protein [Chloroflexi bacterium]|nr:NUDIX domain-containing protein [Chloroflexota bacterium]
MIIEREGTVLLARPHHSPDFALVAGFVEPYETIEAAAVREVREETGLEVRIEGILGSYSCEPMGRNLVLVVCVATIVGGEFRLQEEELAEAQWFPLEQLPDWPEGTPLPGVFEDYRER